MKIYIGKVRSQWVTETRREKKFNMNERKRIGMGCAQKMGGGMRGWVRISS
jgi:hypothetical protein